RGVTCLVCHSVRDYGNDGNAGYVLTNAPVPIPDPDVPDSVAAHVARVSLDELDTTRLCGTCHRVTAGLGLEMPHLLPGVEDLGDFRASAFAGNHSHRVDSQVPTRNCVGCHMEREAAPRDAAATGGNLASHRFAGAHTTIAAASRDCAQLAQVQAQLQRAASIDVPGVWSPRGFTPSGDEALRF